MKERSYGIIPYTFTSKGVSIMVSKSSRGMKAFDFVKGKIEEGETIEECVAREVQEEIGIEIDTNDLEDFFTQKNKRKDIGLFLINWDKYFKQRLKLQRTEICAVKWVNIDNIPPISKNQELIITPLLEKFNKINYSHKVK